MRIQNLVLCVSFLLSSCVAPGGADVRRDFVPELKAVEQAAGHGSDCASVPVYLRPIRALAGGTAAGIFHHPRLLTSIVQGRYIELADDYWESLESLALHEYTHCVTGQHAHNLRFYTVLYRAADLDVDRCGRGWACPSERARDPFVPPEIKAALQP